MKSLRYIVLLSLAVLLLASCVGLPPVFPSGQATQGSEERTAAPEASAVVEPTAAAPAPVAPAVEATAPVTETAVVEATAVISATAPVTETAPVETTAPVTGTVESAATPTTDQVMGANPLVGVTWEWAALLKTKPATQSVVPDPTSYTIVFADDGSIAIKADCNNAAGTYTLDNDSLTIQLGPTTMAACPPGSLSNAMLTGLSKVSTYLIDGGDLVLRLGDSGDSMLFRSGGPSASAAAPVATEAPAAAAAPATPAAPAAVAPAAAAGQPPLVGTVWQWEKFIDVATGKSSMDVKDPQNYTVTFAADGSAAMKADCNNAAGNYTTDGAKITINVGPVTLAACGPDSLSETYLINLTSAATYTIENGKLNLDLFADGGRMVFSPAK
jgi:heat shock protein HslJ